MVICSPWLIPSPRYLPNCLLLQRTVSRRRRRGVAVADYAAGIREEITLTGLARAGRVAIGGVSHAATGNRKGVAALLAGVGCATEYVIQKTSFRWGRLGAGSNRSKVRQWRREASVRIGRRISDLSRVNATHGADSRSFVRSDSGTEQVRDSDRGDNKNNRDDDQKFDEWEALLFAHCSSFSQISSCWRVINSWPCAMRSAPHIPTRVPIGQVHVQIKLSSCF